MLKCIEFRFFLYICGQQKILFEDLTLEYEQIFHFYNRATALCSMYAG